MFANVDKIEAARSRVRAIASGATPVKVVDGPSWVYQLIPSSRPANPLPDPDTLKRSVLSKFKPLQTPLSRSYAGSQLAVLWSWSGEEGFHGYTYLTPERVIEAVGVMPVGYWCPHQNAWVPSSYELPLMSLVEADLLSTLGVLGYEGPTTLVMSLYNVGGTAFITDDRGERAVPLPDECRFVDFPVVELDFTSVKARCSAVVSSLNYLRRTAGGDSNPTPFYLKCY